MQGVVATGMPAPAFVVRLLPASSSQQQQQQEQEAAYAQRLHAQHWAAVTHMLSRVYDVAAVTARMDAHLRHSAQATTTMTTTAAAHDGSEAASSLHCAFDVYAPEVVMRSVRALVESRHTSHDSSSSSNSHADTASSTAPPPAQQLLTTLEACWQQYTHAVVQHLCERTVAQLPQASDDTSTTAATRHADVTAIHNNNNNNSNNNADGDNNNNDSSGSLAGAQYAFASVALLWHVYKAAVQETCAVWTYLARWYAAQPTGMAALEQVAVRCLAHALHAQPRLVHAALDGFLHAIQCDLAVEADAMCKHNNNNNDNNDNDGDDAVLAMQRRRRRTLRAFTDAALAVQLYFTRVQPLVLSAVQAHYNACVTRMFEQPRTSAQRYVVAVTTALAGERARVRAYLHPHTLPLLDEVAQRTLLSERGRAIVQRDFATLIDARDFATLTTLWRLYTHCAYVDAAAGFVSGLFRKYVEDVGRACMAPLETLSGNSSNSSGSSEFATVRAMMSLLHRAEEVVARSFADDSKTFTVQLNEALAVVLELHAAAFAEQLALYVDATMHAVTRGQLPLHNNNNKDDSHSDTRSGASTHAADVGHVVTDDKDSAAATATAVSTTATASTTPCAATTLRDIGALFAHHPSKDYFEHYYWSQLARRLLRAPHTATFAEEVYFVAVLRDICGAPFVAKYEGMLRDLHASRDLDDAYRAWSLTQAASAAADDDNNSDDNNNDNNNNKATTATENDDEAAAVDVSMTILTNGMWPTQTPLSLVLPSPSWRALVQRVEQFYTHTHRKRRLTWQHQLSTAVLRAHASASPRQQHDHNACVYVLSGTTLQCAALLLLDDLLPARSRNTNNSNDNNDNDNDAQDANASAASSSCVTVQQLCQRLGVDVATPDVMASLCGLCHDSCKVLLRTRVAEKNNNKHDNDNNSSSSTADDGNSGGSRTAAPLQPHDTLCFNDDFVPATLRVRLPLPTRMKVTTTTTTTSTAAPSTTATSATNASLASAAAAVQQARDHVTAERNMQLEVAMVSYMKAQRTAKHDALVAAVTQKVSFAVTTAAIKRVLDKMLTRGFLERVGHDTYRYIA